MTIKEKVLTRLQRPPEGERTRGIMMNLKQEQIAALEGIAKTMTEISGNRVSRNMLIQDAIEAYVKEYELSNALPEQIVKETQSMKLYSPLTADTFGENEDAEYDYENEMIDVDPQYYENEIRAAVENYSSDFEKGGLAEYINNTCLKDKITSIVPGVEMVGNNLYGVFHIEYTEDLSSQELAELKDYCTGQASDGWGEGFEQEDIKTSDGNINVHFWDSDGGYFIDTEQEFEQRMSDQSQSMTM